METKAIGMRIKIAREEAGITQLELSQAIGCTSQHISAIERGVKTPTLETFVTIASVLNVPSDVLLQDVLPAWWTNWDKEIDRVLAPLVPHMRAYIRNQILEYHLLEEQCAQMGRRLPQL